MRSEIAQCLVVPCVLLILCGGSQDTSATPSSGHTHGPHLLKPRERNSSRSGNTYGPHLLKPHKRNSSRSGKITCDRYFCNCNGQEASCTGENRTVFYLPWLPPEIRKFRMFRAKFIHMNRTMMSNLSNFQLEVMNLTNNQIHSIDNDTFADFPNIQILDLSFNPIPVPELRFILEGMASKMLSTLSLGAMEIMSLPDDFFHMFWNRLFKKVDLQKNRLQTFNNALFIPFRRVNKVDLAQNRITDVSMPVRVNIKELILKENRLQTFPDLSRNRSQTRGDRVCQEAFYYLQSLTVATNPIRRLPPTMLRGDCFPHLRHLDISATLVKELEDNVIADLPELQTWVVSQMDIKHFRSGAFNSSSLTKLNLDGNQRFVKEKMDFAQVFQYCPNLQHLTIVDTKLQMTVSEMFSFLLPLRSLRILQMQRNRLGFLPPDLLWRLPNLTTLRYTGNNLNSYGLSQALEKVQTLTHLNVQANSITVLNQSTLPWPFRAGLKWIDLSQNPFTCTCDLLWFRQWADEVEKNGSVNVHNLAKTSQYRCSTPPHMNNVPLNRFRPTAQSCAVTNLLALVGVVGASFLMGLMVLLALIYRYRWHLRYYIYRLRRRRHYTQVPGGLQSEDGMHVQLFRYDAYLAYSPRDLDWVVQKLLPVMEGEHRLRVFVYDRDSVPGTVLIDNISRYMDESARIVLLISDHYMKDGWRQCEFENLLYATFEQQKDVIVILLGDVEAGCMPRDMRRMLTRGTFLQWGNSPEACTAFNNGLKVALATQDNSFHNLC